MSKASIRLPLKWVGGKSEMIGIVSALINRHVSRYGTRFRLVEPFCGGLSVSLSIQNDKIYSYWNNDINSSLIHLYKTIASDRYTELIELISELDIPEYNTKVKYDEIRERYNSEKFSTASSLSIQHAADFFVLK